MVMLMDCPTATVGSALPVTGLVITGAAAWDEAANMNNCKKKTAIARRNHGKSRIFCGIFIM